MKIADVTVGARVAVNLLGHSMHGQTFEVTKVNKRHQFVVARATKRFADYRKGDDLRFTGTLLAALEAAS